MKLLLGMLMVLMVSGDGMETIKAFLGRDVRLSCACLDRNLSKEFKWQIEKKATVPQLIYIHNKTASNHGESYKGRVQTFLDQNISDCSILLKNVTTEDQGEYKCIFYQGNQYNKPVLNLTVFPRHSIHQHPTLTLRTGEKVFQCDVRGGDNQTTIQWKLDGNVLENSPTTKISTTYTQHAPTGLFNFQSELKTNLSWTSEPKCEVVLLTTPVSKVPPEPQVLSPETPLRTRSYIAFPLVLVLGSFLILCYRRKDSEASTRTPEE